MNLYDYCQENKIEVKLACEVGFWRLADSQIKEFIEDGIQCWVFDVLHCDIGDLKNVNFFHTAIGYEERNAVAFVQYGASTYKKGIYSPAVINKGHKYKSSDLCLFPLNTFDDYDTGTIDIISIDIEGMEWAVLCNMKSLPKIIEIEMEWKKYINPSYDTIKHWMKINGYKLLEHDGSDHIYIRTT